MIRLQEILSAIKPYVLGWCGGYATGTWTVSAWNFTVTGSPTFTGRYTRIGNRVWFTIQINKNGGTIAGDGTTSQISLPFAVGQDNTCEMSDSGNHNLGIGMVFASVDRVYPPAFTNAGTGSLITISGNFETE